MTTATLKEPGISTEALTQLLEEYRTNYGDEAMRKILESIGLQVNVPAPPARPRDQKPVTYVVKAYVPGPGGDHHEAEVYTLRACGSAEVAADFSQTAQEAADRFYSTEDIPADWEYEAEDWLEDKLQPLNRQHDKEVVHICTTKGIPQHYSQEGYDSGRHDAVCEQAAAVVGCSINPNDPKMWYRCGIERPRYYVEEVPTE